MVSGSELQVESLGVGVDQRVVVAGGLFLRRQHGIVPEVVLDVVLLRSRRRC